MKCIQRTAVVAAVGLATGLWIIPHDIAWAQAQYNVGNRVAAPVGNQYFDSVVLVVNPTPLSYRVHPLGFGSTDDFTANPQMLRPCGSVSTQPFGGIANDPYLVAAQGLPPCSPLPVPGAH